MDFSYDPNGEPENKVDRQNDSYSNTSLMNFRQAELIAASQHVLDLGERASIELLRDIARGRDVMTTCDDFRRIHAPTYHALVSDMPAPFVGGCQ